MRESTYRFGLAMLVGVLVVGVASTGALAGGGQSASPGGEAVTFGDRAFTVSDATIEVRDVHVTGPGLPDESIDEATYVVEDATVRTDGFGFTYGENRYEVGPVSVTLEDVGVVLENVTVGSA